MFNEYDPPRIRRGRGLVHPTRRARVRERGRARPGVQLRPAAGRLGPRGVPTGSSTENLADAAAPAASSTWVFSNHDVVRHATRYGLPAGTARQAGRQGLAAQQRHHSELDVELGPARARAAMLLMLALPGSAYLYQGEELGSARGRRPARRRAAGPVVLPLRGRGEGPRRLPGAAAVARRGLVVRLRLRRRRTCRSRPGSGRYSVEAQEGDPASTLSLYRKALDAAEVAAVRRVADLARDRRAAVLHFERPGGWQSVTNFGAEPVALPAGTVVLTSGPLEGDRLPGDTTAWLCQTGSACLALGPRKPRRKRNAPDPIPRADEQRHTPTLKARRCDVMGGGERAPTNSKMDGRPSRSRNSAQQCSAAWMDTSFAGTAHAQRRRNLPYPSGPTTDAAMMTRTRQP